MSRTSPIGSLIWSKASSMRLVRLFQSDFGTRSIRHQPYNIFIFSDKGDSALNSFTSHLGHFCAFQGVSNLHQKSQNSERKYGRATIDRIQRTLGKTTIMWCKISSTHRNVMSAGMDDFLQKPAMMADIKLMIEKWFDDCSDSSRL